MASKALKAFVAGVAVLGIAVAANGDCRQFFRQQVVYQQPYIAQPVVLYQAGRDVELDALAERVAQRIEQRLIQGQRQAVQKHPVQAPDAQSMSSPEAPALVMAQHCAKCHSGATPKAGLVFDGETLLECWHITKALRAIRDDKMPKDHRLTPEQKGAIMEELLALENKPELAAPEPVPDQP